MSTGKFQSNVTEPLEWLLPIAYKLHESLQETGSFSGIVSDVEKLRGRLTADMVTEICGKAIDQFLAHRSPVIAYYIGLVLVAASQQFFDKETEAIAALSTGAILIKLREEEGSRSYLKFACNVFEKKGDQFLYAAALQRIGASYLHHGDQLDKGLPYLEKSLTIAQKLKSYCQ